MEVDGPWIIRGTRKDIKDLLDGEDGRGGAEKWRVYWRREHPGKCAIGDGQLNSRSPTKVRKLNNTYGRFTKLEVQCGCARRAPQARM
jgi:hypothetical protein